jgi:hypothetical protein
MPIQDYAIVEAFYFQIELCLLGIPSVSYAFQKKATPRDLSQDTRFGATVVTK